MGEDTSHRCEVPCLEGEIRGPSEGALDVQATSEASSTTPVEGSQWIVSMRYMQEWRIFFYDNYPDAYRGYRNCVDSNLVAYLSLIYKPYE